MDCTPLKMVEAYFVSFVESCDMNHLPCLSRIRDPAVAAYPRYLRLYFDSYRRALVTLGIKVGNRLSIY